MQQNTKLLLSLFDSDELANNKLFIDYLDEGMYIQANVSINCMLWIAFISETYQITIIQTLISCLGIIQYEKYTYQ